MSATHLSEWARPDHHAVFSAFSHFTTKFLLVGFESGTPGEPKADAGGAGSSAGGRIVRSAIASWPSASFFCFGIMFINVLIPWALDIPCQPVGVARAGHGLRKHATREP